MRQIVILFTALWLGACGPVDEVDPTADWSVERFYSEARKELAKENYRELLRTDSNDWHAKYNLEHALHLLPESSEQEIDEDIMPERSPRALTAAPSRGELP